MYFKETMDAFQDDFAAVPEVDPAAEFLAREHDQLAGLEDLMPEVSQPQPTESANLGYYFFHSIHVMFSIGLALSIL